MQITEDLNTDAAYIELSLAYYRLKRYEEAIVAAKKSIKLNPKNAAAYNNICASNCALKNWEIAIEACNKAIELEPDLQIAKNNLNWAVGELKKLN